MDDRMVCLLFQFQRIEWEKRILFKEKRKRNEFQHVVARRSESKTHALNSKLRLWLWLGERRVIRQQERYLCVFPPRTEFIETIKLYFFCRIHTRIICRHLSPIRACFVHIMFRFDHKTYTEHDAHTNTSSDDLRFLFIINLWMHSRLKQTETERKKRNRKRNCRWIYAALCGSG